MPLAGPHPRVTLVDDPPILHDDDPADRPVRHVVVQRRARLHGEPPDRGLLGDRQPGRGPGHGDLHGWEQLARVQVGPRGRLATQIPVGQRDAGRRRDQRGQPVQQPVQDLPERLRPGCVPGRVGRPAAEVRVVAAGRDPGQVRRGRAGQVGVGGQPGPAAHGPFLQQRQAGAEHVAEHRVDEPDPGRRVQAERVKLGQGRVDQADSMRAERRAAERQPGEPRMPLHRGPAGQAEAAQRGPPPLAPGHLDLGVDLIGHQVAEPVLAAHVPVQRHRAALAEPRGPRAHGYLAVQLLVGQLNGGGHDPVPAQLLGGLRPGGLVEPDQSGGGPGVGGIHGGHTLAVGVQRTL